MASYLFRRANGTYYARFVIPTHLRPALGRSELRQSLHTQKGCQHRRPSRSQRNSSRLNDRTVVVATRSHCLSSRDLHGSI
ncbi:DUF6538 domain-containing protein [Ferrimonas gelatinilytica]|uniref:DUF6538 domain-containing protein n=1 Tax=Ferrimonas gelatinilytica TaxID=1255257 RepID=UPI003CD08FF2